MTNPITLGDIVNNVSDLNQNFTITNIDLGNIKRQINRAYEHVQRRLGLPSDKKSYNFYFYQDILNYDCPLGFSELIQLYYTPNTSISYNSSNLANPNVPANRWNIYKDTEILRSTGNNGFNGGCNGFDGGYSRHNRVAYTTNNGKSQLLLSGRNLRGSTVINSLDTPTGLTGSASIGTMTADSNVKYQGSASVKFDISAAETASTVTQTGNWDIRDLMSNYSAYRLYVDFPVGTTGYFSNVELRFTSSTGNYYSILATLQADGTAWIDTGWSFLSFPLSSATTVGSPDASAIKTIDIIFNHSGTFVPVSNMRIDYFYNINPDLLTCVHYTMYKGTDATGTTNKIILDQDTDICAFGDIAPDLIDPIATRAALKLWPQLRGDISFWQIYKSDYDEVMKALGRVFPRTRSTGNAGSTEILR